MLWSRTVLPGIAEKMDYLPLNQGPYLLHVVMVRWQTQVSMANQRSTSYPGLGDPVSVSFLLTLALGTKKQSSVWSDQLRMGQNGYLSWQNYSCSERPLPVLPYTSMAAFPVQPLQSHTGTRKEGRGMGVENQSPKVAPCLIGSPAVGGKTYHNLVCLALFAALSLSMPCHTLGFPHM